LSEALTYAVVVIFAAGTLSPLTEVYGEFRVDGIFGLGAWDGQAC
jgi:hypothetical protein